MSQQPVRASAVRLSESHRVGSTVLPILRNWESAAEELYWLKKCYFEMHTDAARRAEMYIVKTGNAGGCFTKQVLAC